MGYIGGKNEKMSTFRVCITHWQIIETRYCPRDVARNRQSPLIENCHLAGEFKTRKDAERWMLRDEVLRIEDETEQEVTAM